MTDRDSQDAATPDLLDGVLEPGIAAALAEACPLFFDRNRFSALEVLLQEDMLSDLLHSAEATGAARALGKAAGAQDFPDAVGLLFGLRHALDRRRSACTVPAVTTKTLSEAAAKTFARLPPAEARFAMMSALVQLSPAQTEPEKRLARLVSSLRSPLPAEMLGIVDRLLGDMLAVPAIVQCLFPAGTPMASRISGLLDLSEGRGEALAKTVPMLAALIRSEAYPRLGQTRRGARSAAIALLGAPGRLASASLEPSDLAGLSVELTGMQDLGKRIRRLADADEERRLRKALRLRASWLLQEPILASVLSGLDVYGSLRALFELQAATAELDMRPVDERLRRMLGDRNLSAELRAASPTISGQARANGELHRLALHSSFPPHERERFAKMFDGFQMGLLKRSQILDGISTEKRVDMDLLLQAVDLLADEVFPEGDARKAVHRTLQRTIRRPLFFRTLLDSEDDRQARNERLTEVIGRLRAAGIPCRSPQDLCILCVDDEPGARKFVRMILEELAVGEILEAGDGQEALDMVEGSGKVLDLIIADWRMPRMNGLELLKRVRKSHAQMPFLMITALATVPAVREAMHYEVDAYLAKPFPPEQLEEKILTLINR